MALYRIASLLLIFFCVQIASGSDGDILLQLKNDTNIRFPSWSASDLANYCSWEGIQCDGNARVIELVLSRGNNSAPTVMRGLIPSYIANLTNLQIFSIDYNDVWGPLPAQIWNLTDIGVISARDTGISVQLPVKLPPNMYRLLLPSANLLEPATLPDSDFWEMYEYIDFRQTNLRCPLPPNLVNFFVNRNQQLPNCRLATTFLTVDENNMVCGQIPLHKFGCQLFPLSFLPPHFPSDSVAPIVQRRVEFSTHVIEFNGDEIFMFAAYRSRSGLTTAYRGEYVHFKTYPIAEILDNSNAREFIYNHNTSKWDSFILDSPTRIRANLSRVDDLILEFVFEEKRDPEPDAVPYIKFSYQVYNFGHAWRFRAPNIPNISNRTVSVSFTLNHKVAHSEPNGPYMTCFGGLVRGDPFTNCTGPLATFKTVVPFGRLSINLSTQTNKTRMVYDYVLFIYSDDQLLTDSSKAAIEAARIPYPLPAGYWLTRFRDAGGIPSFPTMPYSNQTLILPVEMSFLPFVNRALYDPDVSITLLFDPSKADPSDPPQVATAINDAITAGVIAAIVIVVVAVGIGLTVGAVYLFPYLAKRREEAAKLAVIDETPKPAAPSESRWSKAKPRSNDDE